MILMGFDKVIFSLTIKNKANLQANHHLTRHHARNYLNNSFPQ